MNATYLLLIVINVMKYNITRTYTRRSLASPFSCCVKIMSFIFVVTLGENANATVTRKIDSNRWKTSDDTLRSPKFKFVVQWQHRPVSPTATREQKQIRYRYARDDSRYRSTWLTTCRGVARHIER